MQVDYRIPNKKSGQKQIPDVFRIPNTNVEKLKLPNTDQKNLFHTVHRKTPPPPLSL